MTGNSITTVISPRSSRKQESGGNNLKTLSNSSQEWPQNRFEDTTGNPALDRAADVLYKRMLASLSQEQTLNQDPKFPSAGNNKTAQKEEKLSDDLENYQQTPFEEALSEIGCKGATFSGYLEELTFKNEEGQERTENTLEYTHELYSKMKEATKIAQITELKNQFSSILQQQEYYKAEVDQLFEHDGENVTFGNKYYTQQELIEIKEVTEEFLALFHNICDLRIAEIQKVNIGYVNKAVDDFYQVTETTKSKILSANSKDDNLGASEKILIETYTKLLDALNDCGIDHSKFVSTTSANDLIKSCPVLDANTAEAILKASKVYTETAFAISEKTIEIEENAQPQQEENPIISSNEQSETKVQNDLAEDEADPILFLEEVPDEQPTKTSWFGSASSWFGNMFKGFTAKLMVFNIFSKINLSFFTSKLYNHDQQLDDKDTDIIGEGGEDFGLDSV